MPNDNDRRRERARTALRAVSTHYGSGEEGITDAISDMTHLAAAQGIDVGALLDRCRRNFEAEAAAAGERPLRRYALLAVVEAASPEHAWESVSGLLGGLEGDGEPECVYVGAPWRGVPPDAEDLGTESVRVGFSLPDPEDEGFLTATKELRPCD
jgi:hypothetical protein